ncbi:mofrl family protein [Rhodobacteraceae bacterium KLH11]|nr:mofrl family protein [Rhodobacteraceae bacterium KLH11]
MQDIWYAGVSAVDGYRATLAAIQTIEQPDQIVAVGKAAGAMAHAAAERFGTVPCLVVTKDGHGHDLPTHIKVLEASHPVPDARSLTGGQALRETVQGMGTGSRLLLLVSGGASSLAEDLVPGKTLDDLATLNRQLLAEGLDIGAMNTQRRKLSRIKGGGLLSCFPGERATVLAISDVPGDDLGVIGSGIGALPDRPGFEAASTIIASNAHARDAAARAAGAAGFDILANEETMHDDYLTVASRIGQRLCTMPKGAMIFGGEPTVVLPDQPGRGGRNQALALALAREIAGQPGLTVIVGGTDGTDGPTNAAGAIVTGQTWTAGARNYLDRADSGSFLDTAGALLVTGPTGTNVMDLVIAIKD